MAKRGLLDFSLTALTCAMVYTQTPVGTLIDRPLAWLFHGEPPQRSLTRFFDLEASDRNDGAPTAAELERLAAARRHDAPDLAGDARAFGVPYALLRAIEMAGGDTGIRMSGKQWSRARALLRRELPAEPKRAANLAATVLIASSAEQHGSLDAGLEALVLGDAVVERAMLRARQRGAADPGRLESHQRFLTRAQQELARPLVNQVMSAYTALTLTWPLDRGGEVTSPFDERRDPVFDAPHLHNGVDIAVPSGTEILAAHDGRVERATYDRVRGHTLELNHGYSLTTAYWHNRELRVSKGDRVKRGQVVALSGSSDRSAGPHLHYIVRIGGRAVDPLWFR